MPSTNPQAAQVSCPGCGAQYDFPASMAGKRGRCAQCGTQFTVPAPTASDSAARRDWPEYIGVECRICGTRMYGGPDRVGQKLKCPDCGARTVLPPPPTIQQKNMPAALEGEQYELWDADEAPLPREIAAHQPKYIAVPCDRCSTLMYPTEEQVGQTIACPDCGRKQVVPPPAAPKPTRSPITSTAETPVLDPAAAPGVRPPAVSPELRRKIYEEERDSEYGRALEKSRRTGKPIEVDVRGRPIMPRWPLVTGVLPFLFSPGVPARWLGAGLGFFATVSIMLTGLKSAAGGGLGAISGMCFFAIGVILTSLCAAMAFSSFLTIVTESSEGVKQIQNWPPILDWFGSLLAMIVAGMMSAFPGWAIGSLVLTDPSQTALLIAASIVLCLPVILLSQLDISSMWAMLSPRVGKSLTRCPFSWLMFYVESAAIAAGCIAASLFAAKEGMNAVLVPTLLGTFAMFLYARLLGRLGWRLAEAMAN